MAKYYCFLKKVYNIWRKTRPYTGLGFCKQAIEMYKLHCLNLLEPEEYYYYHLFKDDLDWEEKTRFLSRNQYHLMERRMNPREDVGVLNKLVFNVFANALGLPVPRMYGVFEPNFGYTLSMNPLQTADDLNTMFTKYREASFIIKPIGSYKGMSILKCKAGEDGKIMIIGEGEITASELYDRLSNTTFSKHQHVNDSYLIERAIIQHSFLDNYCDTSAQTIRIVTYITNSGDIQILAAYLKIVCKGSHVDNIAISNLGARVDPDGVLDSARSPQENDVITYDKHPDTDYPIKGEKLPYFNEAIELAKLAQSKIHYLRTIGWDIVISDDGPVIIEGNFGWDHVCIQQVMRKGIIDGQFESELHELMSANK